MTSSRCRDWIVCPGHADQDAEDEDLEVGERLLQLRRQALCLRQEGYND